jgi:hypothetical protein
LHAFRVGCHKTDTLIGISDDDSFDGNPAGLGFPIADYLGPVGWQSMITISEFLVTKSFEAFCAKKSVEVPRCIDGRQPPS